METLPRRMWWTGLVLQEGFSKISCFTIVLSGFVKKKLHKSKAEELFSLMFEWPSKDFNHIGKDFRLCCLQVNFMFPFCALFEWCQILWIFTPLLCSKFTNWFISYFPSLFSSLSNLFVRTFLKKHAKLDIRYFFISPIANISQCFLINWKN